MINLSISQTIRAWFSAPLIAELATVKTELAIIKIGVANIQDKLGKVVHKMAELDDKIDAVGVALDGVGANLSTLGTDLSAEIQQIKDAIAAGSVSAESLAKLDALAAKAAAFGTQVTDLSTTVKGIVTP